MERIEEERMNETDTVTIFDGIGLPGNIMHNLPFAQTFINDFEEINVGVSRYVYGR